MDYLQMEITMQIVELMFKHTGVIVCALDWVTKLCLQ